jgi:hypothetical protein
MKKLAWQDKDPELVLVHGGILLSVSRRARRYRTAH